MDENQSKEHSQSFLDGIHGVFSWKGNAAEIILEGGNACLTDGVCLSLCNSVIYRYSLSMTTK